MGPKIELKYLICHKQRPSLENIYTSLLSARCTTSSESVKYLGVKIHANLTWQHHVKDLSIKLNRANALLFKMRKYVSLKILRSIYIAIFDAYLPYCCLVWAENFSTIQRILILQKKAVKICLENILFVSKSLNNLSPSIFNTWFSFSSDQHNHETSSSTPGNLMKNFYETNRYGKYSITISAVK